MLSSLASSLGTMFWSMVVLALILYVFSLTITELMISRLEVLREKKQEDFHLRQQCSSEEKSEECLIYSHFGSPLVTALTLYKCSSGGIDWKDVGEVVQAAGADSFLVFIFF